MWPSLLLLLITTLGPLYARPARAEDARQSALARSLFEEGVSLADHGNWVGAADRFARAYSLKPTSAVAFNWGSALMETGRLVEARELLSKVEQDGGASAELKRESRLRLDALAARLAHVRVHVSAADSDELTLELDTHPLPRAAWDVPSPVDPGPHVLVLREDGDERARSGFTLVEGERRDVTLSIGAGAHPVSFVAAPVGDQQPRKPLWKSWKLWTAVGAVVVTGAVIAIVVARSGGDADPVRGNANPGVIRW